MKFYPSSRAGLGALTVLSLTASAAAHSWIEKAYRIDQATRKFIGAPGYPRGGDYRRLSAEGTVNDGTNTYRLPVDGAYTGDEKINRLDFALNREDEIFKAAPGDYIAILHTENGHVTEKLEGRPLNGGNIYLYGTSDTKDDDKLFDIHLKWNKDGTGGDRRGRLLGTSNYDDGQCYEGNASGEFAMERSKAAHGTPEEALICQSDIQLPQDLKPGSVYTIYWYWDWPTLNTNEIPMEGTKEGRFPWMGTFMRGEKDPHGFTQAALHTNESYASTLDIQIVEKSTFSAAKALSDETIANLPDTYKMAIKQQLDDGGFAIKVDGGDDGAIQSSAVASAPMDSPTAPAPTSTPQAGGEAVVTVTVTETVHPPSPTPSSKTTSTKTVVEMETLYKIVYATETADEEAGNQMPTSTGAPTTTDMPSPTHPAASSLPKDITSYFVEPTSTPVLHKRRTKWSFGDY